MKKKINLVYKPKSEFKEKLFYFIYYYLRYILVIVQIIVIFVFFNKLRYDQEIVDLEESISQKNEIINVSKPLIEQFLYYYRKIEVIAKINDNQHFLEDQLQYLIKNIPKEIVLTSLIYEKDNFILSGYSSNAENIRLFYLKMKRDNRFKVINFSNLKKNTNNYGFVISLKTWQK